MNSKFVDGGSCVEDECQLEQKLKNKSFKNVMVMFSIDCFGPGRTSVYIGPFKAKIKRVQTSFQVFQANYHGEIMDSHYGFLRVGCLNDIRKDMT